MACQRLTPEQAPPHQWQHPVGNGRFLHVQRCLLELRTAFTAGVQGCHQTAGGRTHHQLGPQAGFFQHGDHADMGEPAGSAATERQAQLHRPLDHGWRDHAGGTGQLTVGISGRFGADSAASQHRQQQCCGARRPNGPKARLTITENYSCLH